MFTISFSGFQVPVCSGGILSSPSLIGRYRLLPSPPPHLPPHPLTVPAPPADPLHTLTCPSSGPWVELTMVTSRFRRLLCPRPISSGETLLTEGDGLKPPAVFIFSFTKTLMIPNKPKTPDLDSDGGVFC